MSVEVTLLQKYPLFSDLDETQLCSMAELFQSESFGSGYTIFEEGKPGATIFIVTDGEVEMLFAIGEEGEAKVDRIGIGGIIGCSALVRPYSYNATARCLTQVKVLTTDVSRLRRLFEQEPSMAVMFYEHLIQSLLDRIVNLRLESGK